MRRDAHVLCGFGVQVQAKFVAVHAAVLWLVGRNRGGETTQSLHQSTIHRIAQEGARLIKCGHAIHRRLKSHQCRQCARSGHATGLRCPKVTRRTRSCGGVGKEVTLQCLSSFSKRGIHVGEGLGLTLEVVIAKLVVAAHREPFAQCFVIQPLDLGLEFIDHRHFGFLRHLCFGGLFAIRLHLALQCFNFLRQDFDLFQQVGFRCLHPHGHEHACDQCCEQVSFKFGFHGYLLGFYRCDLVGIGVGSTVLGSCPRSSQPVIMAITCE